MKIRIASVVVTVFLMGFAGCTSVRNARYAQNPDNIPAGERTVTADEIGIDDNTVLSLNKAIEIALKYHPSIVRARQSLVSSGKSYSNAIAAYLPSMSASGSYRKSTSNSDTKTADNESGKSYSASTSLSQLVYDFGGTTASIRQSYENKLASESDFKSTGNGLVYNVKQAYYNLIYQQALVKVSEETVTQFEEHLTQTEILVKVGRRIKYDITKAEVDLGNARIGLINAHNSLKTARATLNSVMGLGKAPEYKIKEPELDKIIGYEFDRMIGLAKANQPELISQNARVRAASAYVDVSIADLFPSLSLSGGYSWGGSDFPLVWNWSLSSALSFTIFNGFQKTNKIDSAVASLRSSRATQAELEQKIYLDITKALAQLESAGERLKLTELTVKQADETLTLITERFKIGKASSVEVTDAQVSLTKTHVERIQARFDYQTAVASIEKTVGLKINEMGKE